MNGNSFLSLSALLGRFFFLSSSVKEGKGVWELKGEKTSSTKREQSATPKQLEVLAHILEVHII